MDKPPSNITLIKLSSGDTLIASLNIIMENELSYAVIENPVKIDTVYNNVRAITIVAQRWLLTDDKVFKIPAFHIVTTASPNDYILECYKGTLEELRESDESIQNDHDKVLKLFSGIPFKNVIH